MPENLVHGPSQSHSVEFTGRSLTEMFRTAADWCATNDGAVRHLLAVGIHKLDDKPYDSEVWYAMTIAYD